MYVLRYLKITYNQIRLMTAQWAEPFHGTVISISVKSIDLCSTIST
jgi:hypothetical protein